MSDYAEEFVYKKTSAVKKEKLDLLLQLTQEISDKKYKSSIN